MFTVLLCAIFAKGLSLNGLTLPALFSWFCNHPFLFIFAIEEIILEGQRAITQKI